MFINIIFISIKRLNLITINKQTYIKDITNKFNINISFAWKNWIVF